MKQKLPWLLLITAVGLLVAQNQNQPQTTGPVSVGRFQLLSATVAVDSRDQRTALFRIDTATGKTWMLGWAQEYATTPNGHVPSMAPAPAWTMVFETYDDAYKAHDQTAKQ